MTQEEAAKVRLSALERFSDARTRGDVPELMSYMTENCVSVASVGPEPGRTYYGRRDVERGFVEMLGYDAARERVRGPAFVVGDVGVAECAFRERRPEGAHVLIRGCDILELVGVKIRKKDAFRKVFEPAFPQYLRATRRTSKGNARGGSE
jgi:SnoaL-like domain